jgi:hypothetical protein
VRAAEIEASIDMDAEAITTAHLAVQQVSALVVA